MTLAQEHIQAITPATEREDMRMGRGRLVSIPAPLDIEQRSARCTNSFSLVIVAKKEKKKNTNSCDMTVNVFYYF